MKFKNKKTGKIVEWDCQIIDSARFTAQHRKRTYWTNIPQNPLPPDKGIVLRDIIEHGYTDRLKSYCIDASYHKCSINNYLGKNARRQMIFDKPVRVATIGKGSMGYRIYSIDGKSITINTAGGGLGGTTGLYEIKPYVRKLTPLECERLQTFPSVEKRVEVKLCLDQAKNLVSAVEKNPKLLKLVGNVEKNVLQEYVNFVIQNIRLKNLQTKLIVPQDVSIAIQKKINECIKPNGIAAPLIVNNVEKQKSYQNLAKEEDFVVPHVSINITEGQIVPIGKVEQLQKDNPWLVPINGNSALKLFGNEIMQLVNDVTKNLNTKKDNNFTSTIKSHLGIKNIEQILIILYYFAKNVIIGYTQEKILHMNILIHLSEGYTLVMNGDKQAVSNTQRYRCLGNSFTVDVISHLLQNLQ